MTKDQIRKKLEETNGEWEPEIDELTNEEWEWYDEILDEMERKSSDDDDDDDYSDDDDDDDDDYYEDDDDY